MLKALSIKNYALIDNLSVGFGGGFSVITGETGAGKSILLGALSVILGKRADPGVLKDKSRKCIVEGEFDVSTLQLQPFFEQHDLDYDTIVFLRREILPSGKSRAFINDTPVTLNVLKELGNLLVDIHSQHQTLMLADNRFQLDVLDNYLSNTKAVAKYALLYRQYISLKKELKRLQEMELALKQEEDYLKFQFEELDAIELDEQSFDEMEERQQFLAHSEEVIATLAMAGNRLLENEDNIIDNLALVKESLSSIAGYFQKAQELKERLESVWLELKDLADEIASLQTESETDPAELSELTARLDEIYRLQQKHRVQSVRDLLDLKEEYSNKLLGITGVGNEIEKVSKTLNSVTAELEQLASQLTNVRKSGIPKLSKAVEQVLHKLGMKDAAFKVIVQPLENFSPTGKDRVSFWFSANKGMPADDISKIASGGELSRLMLAIKSLVTGKSLLPTVIFDEIDAGVSGDIAGKVGNVMKEMARNHQLIAITHLPQIASKADAHYKVFKETLIDTTQTNMMLLTTDQRVDEIAAMLSDDKITGAAREAAGELLGK